MQEAPKEGFHLQQQEALMLQNWGGTVQVVHSDAAPHSRDATLVILVRAASMQSLQLFMQSVHHAIWQAMQCPSGSPYAVQYSQHAANGAKHILHMSKTGSSAVILLKSCRLYRRHSRGASLLQLHAASSKAAGPPSTSWPKCSCALLALPGPGPGQCQKAAQAQGLVLHQPSAAMKCLGSPPHPRIKLTSACTCLSCASRQLQA